MKALQLLPHCAGLDMNKQAEPITVRYDIDGYRGVDSSSRENFHPRTGKRDAATTFLKPQGITIYGNDPSYSYSELKDPKKNKKDYSDLQIHSGQLDFSKA